MIPIENNVDAQPMQIMFNVEVSSCSTGDCEVITRQYTGIVNLYSIAIRCQQSNGDFGAWQNWSYSGINPGSYCG
ncbi:MAG: hypothetical protein RJQ00_02605 [Vicingaceae bacterium]